MASILRNFEPGILFWEANQLVNTIPEFLELKKKLGVKKSSTVMWAIAFLLDQSEDNVWRNSPYEEAVGLITSDYLDDANFDFDDYEDTMVAFRRHLMTHGERSLLDWKRKLEERDKFLKDVEYTLETVKTIDTAQKDTINIFKVYEQILKMIGDEGNGSIIIGKKQESASEKGQI
ncbi:MAG: hypothetical protein ACI9LF_001167 [Flavobacteriales bacterium]|jgi:hypothetical protein